jgi:uncharacterized protein
MAAKGTKEKGWLETKYRNTGELIRFPVGTVTGTQDGPTLVVFGGMHGSEFAGIDAAIKLFQETDPAKLKGTLKVCTIYNLPAFVNNLGFVVPHDGKNPSACFPGTPVGTYGEAMAYFIDQELLSSADYYIELHGGDIPEALTPFTFYGETGNADVDAKSKWMCEVYNIPFIVKSTVDTAVAPTYGAYEMLEARGVPAILCESGQQGILKQEEVATHLTGLRNVMIGLGMIEGQMDRTAKQTYLTDYTAVRSEVNGMWYPSVWMNDMVKKDQVVGVIRDYWGEQIAEVKAKADSIVTVVRTSPAVKPNNVLLEHGTVVK